MSSESIGTQILAWGPSAACAVPPSDPSGCDEPFGEVDFAAEVDGNHLVISASWTEHLPDPGPGAQRNPVLSAYLFCCDGVASTHFVETTVLGSVMAAQVSLRTSSIASECAGADTLGLRSFLHWRHVLLRGVDPPAVPGAAVFDAVFHRRGGCALVETKRWIGSGLVCFPPVP